MRKRGKLPTPPERVWINERVCEGCGDCGDQSTCLSVVPVQTEFGRKTRIHQSSCNQDLSCLKGDCPSFLLVTRVGAARRRSPRPRPRREVLPTRHRGSAGDVLVRMPGVGGTGVVTVSAILQMAAHLQGLHAAGLEQIGLAQKGGPVISDLRISAAPIDGQLRASRGGVDVLLGFDLLGAGTPETLATADRGANGGRPEHRRHADGVDGHRPRRSRAPAASAWSSASGARPGATTRSRWPPRRSLSACSAITCRST